MDPRWRGDKKQTAKELFGRPLRLALAAWILQRAGEPFYLQEAQDAMRKLGEAASGVADELRRFESHGMLNSLESGRRRYYNEVSSPYWPVFRSAAEALELTSSERA